MKKLISVLLLLCMVSACAASVAAAAQSEKSATALTFDKNVTKYLSQQNSTTTSVVDDDTEAGHSLLLEAKSPYSDPYVFFNYGGYARWLGLGSTVPAADDVKYIILKIKQQSCSNNIFEIFYCAGSIYGATGGYSVATNFEFDDTWQYIVFDMSSAKGWTGKINGFRLDWMQNANDSGESLLINEFILAKNIDELNKYVKPSEGSDDDLHALTARQQYLAEYLIKNASNTVPEISNDPITAAHEDSSISLWFDHSYNNTPAEDVTSTGLNSYQIKLAKNEIEGCHLMLASTADKTGLTLEISDFVNGKGNVLTKEICYGYYFDDVEGKTVADPIPLLEHEFDLTANKSKMFIIKVKSTAETPSGQYTATAVLKDSSGNEIKKAAVYAYVWDFALPETSSCKTLTDLGWHSIYAGHRLYAGDDSLIYSKYYEYLLENKMCAYTLPYSDDGKYKDERVDKYLNDPRMTAYTLMWKTDFTESMIRSAYNKVSQNQTWLEKAYFYPIDEPETKNPSTNPDKKNKSLEEVRSAAETIRSVWGDGYKLIVPMHLNNTIDTKEYKVDWFEYLKGYVNVWCPHTFFFNTYADKQANPALTYRNSKKVEENLGTFPERMANAQESGEEVWWYVTRFPHYPEITLSISDPSVDHRIFFWQQKLYNVDGFLYYAANDWYHIEGTDSNRYMWDKKKEVSYDSYTPYTVYGNGVLVYCGAGLQEYLDRYSEGDFGAVGYYGPVGSLRLESVRDGIEDYDYFTLLDQKYGEGTSDLLIKQITTSLGNFKSDTDLFTTVRLAVGNLIAGAKIDLPEPKAGDIYCDGETDNKDVISLFRYVSGDKPKNVDKAALDCNGDFKANNKDVTILFRFLSGDNSIVLTYGNEIKEDEEQTAALKELVYNKLSVMIPDNYYSRTVSGVLSVFKKGVKENEFTFNFSTENHKDPVTEEGAEALVGTLGLGGQYTVLGYKKFTVDGTDVVKIDYSYNSDLINGSYVRVYFDDKDVLIKLGSLYTVTEGPGEFDDVIKTLKINK